MRVFARTTTREMVKALRDLDASDLDGGVLKAERRWYRYHLIAALERRYPAAAEVVGEAYGQATTDEPIDYAAVLIAAIPHEELEESQ